MHQMFIQKKPKSSVLENKLTIYVNGEVIQDANLCRLDARDIQGALGRTPLSNYVEVSKLSPLINKRGKQEVFGVLVPDVRPYPRTFVGTIGASEIKVTDVAGFIQYLEERGQTKPLKTLYEIIRKEVSGDLRKIEELSFEIETAIFILGGGMKSDIEGHRPANAPKSTIRY